MLREANLLFLHDCSSDELNFEEVRSDLGLLRVRLDLLKFTVTFERLPLIILLRARAIVTFLFRLGRLLLCHPVPDLDEEDEADEPANAKLVVDITYRGAEELTLCAAQR